MTTYSTNLKISFNFIPLFLDYREEKYANRKKGRYRDNLGERQERTKRDCCVDKVINSNACVNQQSCLLTERKNLNSHLAELCHGTLRTILKDS